MDLVFITIPETKSTFFEDNFNNKIGSLKDGERLFVQLVIVGYILLR